MKQLRFIAVFVVLIVIGVLGVYRTRYIKSESVSAQTQQYDWPQVQNTPQRTGYSPETLGTNFSVAWTHPFQPEKVNSRVQAIIYQGKAFVGTEHGNLYALDATTGQQTWKYAIGAPIVSSVGVFNGNIYLGAMNGSVYAVSAQSGSLVWKKDISQNGFSTSTLIADNKIMLGGRDGKLYAFDPLNGNILWQYDTGSPILQTPAWNNGRAFFGTRSMYVYAVNTVDGSLSWKSQKLAGMALKDFWPVVHQGYVLIRPMSKAEQPTNPSLSSPRSLYALNEVTGQETFALPHYTTLTHAAAVAPPCVDRDGNLIVPVPGGSGGWQGGWGRLNLNTRTIFDILNDTSNTSAGWSNADEPFAVSCSQNLVFPFHHYEGGAMYQGVYNLGTRRWTAIGPGYTNGQMNSGFGQTNPASIANGFFYHIAVNELVARRAQ